MKEILFKPFERYSEKTLLIFGVLVTCFGLFISSIFDVRFDGAIDVHFKGDVSMKQALLDVFFSIMSLVLFLFIAGKMVNRKTRMVDIVSTVIVAKSIIYTLSFLNINGAVNAVMNDFAFNQMPKVNATVENIHISSLGYVLIVISLLMIMLMVVWTISLLYNGYKTASNAKESKSVVLFIVALILSEVVSVLLIRNFNI